MKKQAKSDAASVGKVAGNLRDADELRERVTKRLQEIYGGRYGYRQTASGGWRERDEPDAETQYRQSDAINRALQKKRQEASRERLKAAGKVPTRVKTGGKLFEEFCREAYKDRKRHIDDADMRNIYNSARSLDYEKWVWFVNDEYGSRI